MGKKNKVRELVTEEKVDIWCFYCDREFESEKILIEHQKHKHFKCHVCAKRLNSVSGLSIHVTQIHKEIIKALVL